MVRALVLGFISFFLLPAFASAAPLTDTLEVSGWVPYWRFATGTRDLLPHMSEITTVHPFGYIVQSDGTLYDPLESQAGLRAELKQAAATKKVRYIPTVMWQDGEAIHKILSNAADRRALVERIASLAEENGFDGIDLDFEGKLAETKDYFSLFLRELYVRMGKKWVYCTIEPRTPISSRYLATPPRDAGMYANNYVAINKYCDRVQIMAYDQGSIDVRLNEMYDGPYTPIADIAWVEKVMNLAAQTISKKKLVLGIPTYGYEYAVTPLTIEGYRYEVQWAFNYRYADEVAAEYRLTPQRSRGGEMFMTYFPSSTPMVSRATAASQAAGPAAATTQPFNILWWGDSISFAQKVGIAKKLGLRGVAVFKFDGGQDPKIWDIIGGR